MSEDRVPPGVAFVGAGEDLPALIFFGLPEGLLCIFFACIQIRSGRGKSPGLPQRGCSAVKKDRKQEILDIISTKKVETQEQLIQELQQRGVSVSQSTISRDIRQLHLVKEQNNSGVYKYAETDYVLDEGVTEKLLLIFRQGVLSCDWAQNLVVIKTMPGLAGAAASAIDHMELPDIVGSLAGNDTVMLVMRTAQETEAFCDKINREMLR